MRRVLACPALAKASLRLDIFAKGNLDLRDTLHSLRIGGKVAWNGINEVVRAAVPGSTARVRHETLTRSDALLAADGQIPPAIAARALPLGAYPLSSQFSDAMWKTDAGAIVLSIQADVLSALARHRRDGYLIYPYGWQSWPEADRRWLRDEFDVEPPLDVAASLRNFEQIVARLRSRTDAAILVYNLSTVVPGDTVHCHQGLGESLSTRIRRFNLAVIELSQRTGISVVDVDAVIARAGAARVKLDPVHLNAEGCRLVAEETVRVLQDVGTFAGPRATP